MGLTHQQCPKCGHKDCFTWFEKGRGFCHSVCGNVFTEDFVDVKKLEPKGFTYNDIRSIDPKVAEKYGICVHLDDSGKPFRFTLPPQRIIFLIRRLSLFLSFKCQYCILAAISSLITEIVESRDS